MESLFGTANVDADRKAHGHADILRAPALIAPEPSAPKCIGSILVLVVAQNPVLFTERVLKDFLRYQVTTHRFSDPHLQGQLEQLLNLQHPRQSPLIKGPYISLAHAFRPGPPMSELVDEGVLHPHIPNMFTMPALYGHQERACREIAAGKSTIVSTGTGSGKSESFFLPIISRCLQLRDEDALPGIRAVILYPMNALAEDQLSRLRELLCGSGIPFALYVGKTPERRVDVRGVRLSPGSSRADYSARAEQMRRNKESIALHPPEERVSREELRTSGQQPRILLTNPKMLELLLTRASDVELFEGADLEFIVADEAHTFRGANGAEVACLLRRLRSFAGSERTVSVATSATLASGDAESDTTAKRFASRFFGISSDGIEVVREEHVESEWSPQRRADVPLDNARAEICLDLALNALEVPEDQIGGALSSAYRTISNRTLSSHPWHEALYSELSSNETVYQLAHVLTKPTALVHLLETMRQRLGRQFSESEALMWMALGAAAKREGRPLLRPVLHAFIRGIDGAVVTFLQDSDDPKLWLSGQDAASATDMSKLPVLSCTTCGAAYFKASVKGFVHDKNGIGGGTLQEAGVVWEPLSEGLEGATSVVLALPSDEEGGGRSDQHSVFLCRHCGALHRDQLEACQNCGEHSAFVPLAVASEEGKLKTCSECGASGRNAFGSGYREPARPVRASAVAEVHVLAQNMLHHGVRKRLLVFADNRQDSAFQAGWMRDHARRYRIRGLLQDLIRESAMAPGDLISRVMDMLDADDDLSEALIPEVWEHAHKRSEPEGHAKWRRFALHALLTRELTIGHRQSIGLEPWGRLRVSYEGLEPSLGFMTKWSDRLKCEPDELCDSVSAILDSVRRGSNLILDRVTKIWTKYYRDGDVEVQQGYVPATKFAPKKAKLRRSGEETDVIQWLSDKGVTAVMDAATKFGVGSDDSVMFIEELWQLLVGLNILIDTGDGQGKQIDLDKLRLDAGGDLHRCQKCRRTYTRKTLRSACLAYRCKGFIGQDLPNLNNYDLLTIDEQFEMVRPREHSAQVPEKEREKLEIQFKNEADKKLNVLVATPTLELGVDIGALDSVLLRNVPPLPSNYWQRAGRAGRRHRMAVTLTYSRAASHDRAYFQDPLRMLSGVVMPPRFHLGNPVLVAKHVRSIALAHLYRLTRETGDESVRNALKTCLPATVSEWVFDSTGQVRHSPFLVDMLKPVIEREKPKIVRAAQNAFSLGWAVEDADVVSLEAIESIVTSFHTELQEIVNRIYKRVKWALDQKAQLSAKQQRYGTLNPDERVLSARCDRFLKKVKGDAERNRSETEGIDETLTFAVLAAEGLLPGYGLDVGVVQAFAMREGRVADFKLGRSSAMGVREFVPGNLLYANNRRLITTTIHRPGTEEGEDVRHYAVDAEREAISELGSGRAGLGSGQIRAFPVADVDLAARSRISDDEEHRFSMSVAVFAREEGRHRGGTAYDWDGFEIDFRKGLEVTLVNVGESKKARGGEFGFLVCEVCGMCRSPFASDLDKEDFLNHHRMRCGKNVVPSGFYARTFVDALRFKSFPSREVGFSVVESLRQAGSLVLEMESDDLQIVSIGHADADEVDILLYDPMVGGSGLIQEMLERWGEVVAGAQTIASSCPGECEVACVDCLQTYRNSFIHRFLNRHAALAFLEGQVDNLTTSHSIPASEVITSLPTGAEPTNNAERRLKRMMIRAGFPNPVAQKRINLPPPLNWTEPDFYYEVENGSYDFIAIYLDGMSAGLHGNPVTAERDRQIRSYLTDQVDALVVEVAFGHLDDRHAMAAHFSKIARVLEGKDAASRVRTEVEAWFPSVSDDIPDDSEQ